MTYIIYITFGSLICMLAMIAHKVWHIKTGKLEEPDELHLIGPLMHIARDGAAKYYKQAVAKASPVTQKLYSDLLVMVYTATSEIAKRFAKIANEIKGKHELPEMRSGSTFLVSYLKKQREEAMAGK